MTQLSHPSKAPATQSNRAPSRDLVAFLFALPGEWRVRRQIARAQMLDCASLRDIGLASGGVESAIRHGRERQRSS
jgi:hypothetical protein